MGCFLAITLLAFAGFTVVTCQVQLPCNSVLRQYPSLWIYFQHCECTYSGNFTELVTLANATIHFVPSNQCESEIAVSARGFEEAKGGYECDGEVCVQCAGRWNDTYLCKCF